MRWLGLVCILGLLLLTPEVDAKKKKKVKKKVPPPSLPPPLLRFFFFAPRLLYFDVAAVNVVCCRRSLLLFPPSPLTLPSARAAPALSPDHIRRHPAAQGQDRRDLWRLRGRGVRRPAQRLAALPSCRGPGQTQTLCPCPPCLARAAWPWHDGAGRLFTGSTSASRMRSS